MGLFYLITSYTVYRTNFYCSTGTATAFSL
jgi:hypothetical protein